MLMLNSSCFCCDVVEGYGLTENAAGTATLGAS
jgi:long-subunit acyl-CoA synthetase (AMP-forming)